ncbi:MAG TPA: hypothetical protein VE010_07480 [Thermoanaerobaculia bacterium]|nr:hypothetical protein [Thermoanaerobaculia bacterium]
MEVVPTGPSDRDDQYSYDRASVLAAIAPHPLLEAALALPSAVRTEFPMLVRVCPWIVSHYIDESLWIEPQDVRQLERELDRLIRITRRHEFIRGLDGGNVWQHWRGPHSSDEEFSTRLAQLVAVLHVASVKDAWVHLMM